MQLLNIYETDLSIYNRLDIFPETHSKYLLHMLKQFLIFPLQVELIVFLQYTIFLIEQLAKNESFLLVSKHKTEFPD